MCGEGVQPPAAGSRIATCQSCGEVILLPVGWGRPRPTVSAASWRTIRRGVGRLAAASAVGIVGPPVVWAAWTWLARQGFAEESFHDAAILCGVAVVAASLAHMLLATGGLEGAAVGAAALGCSRRASAAAWLLKLTLIAAWCSPIAALFAAVPPPTMASSASLVFRGLLMGAVLAYALASMSACLFLRHVARHIGDRRLPVGATACATAALPLGVILAVGVRWFATPTPAVWPFGNFGFGPAGFIGRAVFGFAACHAAFWLLCRRTIRLVDTELEFTPDAEPTDPAPEPTEPLSPTVPHTE
jgi:hypothetical protein